jgi:tetratricopeptide (TPR) repeat protein
MIISGFRGVIFYGFQPASQILDDTQDHFCGDIRLKLPQHIHQKHPQHMISEELCFDYRVQICPPDIDFNWTTFCIQLEADGQLLVSDRGRNGNKPFLIELLAKEYVQALMKYAQALMKYAQALMKYTQALMKYTQALMKYAQALMKYAQALMKYAQALMKYFHISSVQDHRQFFNKAVRANTSSLNASSLPGATFLSGCKITASFLYALLTSSLKKR